MNGRIIAVLLLSLPLTAQVGTRQPIRQFPPDLIAEDSPIRDLAKLDTKHVHVDTENARTRVLRIVLAANESLPMHDSRDGVLVCITACTLTLTNPVGYTREVKLDAGQSLWIPAARHRISTAAAIEFLYIESKKQPGGKPTWPY